MSSTLIAPAGRTYSIIASGNPALPWRLMLADDHGGDFATCDQALARAAQALRETPKYAQYYNIFLDTETTGVEDFDQVWEIGAIRNDPQAGDTEDRRFHVFVEHDLSLAERLPPSFRADHDARYDPEAALSRADAGRALLDFIQGGADESDRPRFLIGACPWFDDRKLQSILDLARTDAPRDARPAWHYRLQCVESYARGWLRGRGIDPPMTVSSDDLVAMTGFQIIDESGNDLYIRHTAMDDAEWAMDWFNHLGRVGAESAMR